MEAQHGHSAACCNIPPIVSKGYEHKGKYETIGGLNTYVTGPADAKKAIFMIFDIFGFYPQTIQGADILANSDEHNKYLVLMPDITEGNPADISWYPPDTEEKQKKLGNFFQTTGLPPKCAESVPGLVKAMGEKYPSIEKWGMLGFCWGGKIVSLTVSTPSNPFVVAAECHPAMVDSKDAAQIKIPLIMIASKDEDAEEVKKFEANLTGEKHVETFNDQIHGFMAARSNLEDEGVKKEYERGYKTLIQFFGKHLK